MNIWIMPDWMKKFAYFGYIIPKESMPTHVRFNKQELIKYLEHLYNSTQESNLNPYNVMIMERCDLLQKLYDNNLLKPVL